MKSRLILFLVAVLASLIPGICPDAAAGDTVILREDKKDGTDGGRQRIPGQSPVYCVVDEGWITFFCQYEAEGEVTVTDADNVFVVSATAQLHQGYTVVLPFEDCSGARLTVRIGNTIYSATL